MFRICLLVLVVPLTAAALHASDLSGASWIWLQKTSDSNETVSFRREFEFDGKFGGASIIGSCDNEMRVRVNGRSVLSSSNWEQSVTAKIDHRLIRNGRNTITVRASNRGGPAGLILKLEIAEEGGSKKTIVTDGEWSASSDRKTWKKAYVVGKLGVEPWGTLASAAAARPRRGAATPAESLRLLPGFKAELLYTVPKAEQGSWISMTFDPKGRMIVCDQYGALYRITLSSMDIEKLSVEIGGAHGLLYAFDSLYVVNNEGTFGKSRGLYRLRDTSGDDEFDEVEKLKDLAGSGEHGPHSVILSADRKSLYVNGGNHTDVPEITSSRVPTNWDEDLLLPRQWDARGHARGRMAPGGWICHIDPEGKTWELVSVGYRNEFDIALNAHGELFTFDADMEWDMGSPWYRPTRLCHAVSGSEFGWRSGTGKWPAYFPDSLPATLNIGPGSPTGVVMGLGAKFPGKYQHALFILDWTFGTMYAVHLTPNGASYTGKAEEFVSGRPLPLTDAQIGPDGAMYFAVGGRRTQSALYRITYVGDESTAPAEAPDTPEGRELRALRRKIETYHRPNPSAVAAVWPHLGHSDRFIRYAARVALEHQDPATWADRVLAERDPAALIQASIALARQGDKALQPKLIAALDGIDYAKLDHSQKLSLLRAYALVFIRMGKPDRATASRIAKRLDEHFPAGDDMLNRELVRVLVYLDSPTVVAKTLDLMENAKPEGAPDIQALLERNPGYGRTIQAMLANQPVRQQIHYAFCLRNVRYGWTLEQRRRYFSWFPKAANARGGASFQGFLKNIRNEALENTSDAERAALASITGESLKPKSEPKELPTPKGPGREWTLEELASVIDGGLHGRSFENGRKMFRAARCGTCHRFDGSGGTVGSDLTSLVARFSYRDVLESIMTPSKVISDQYESSLVLTKDGRSVIGRIVSADGEEVVVSHDVDDPGNFMTIKRGAIRSIKVSETSFMPEGLLTPLNKDEVLDLFAFLMSRGDKDDPAFR